MDKITFLTRQLNDHITYETDENVYERIKTKVIDKHTYIHELLNEHTATASKTLKQKEITIGSSSPQRTVAKSDAPQIHTLCNIIDTKFDLSIRNPPKDKHTGTNPLNLPSNFPIAKNAKMIGRMSTIKKLTNYTTTKFKYLNLPEEQQNITWDESINDTFILCGYQSALNDYNIKVDMKGKPLGIQSGFTLVLVVDKEQNKYGTFLTESTIHIDSTTNEYEEKTCKADFNCKVEHIFPPTAAYKITTPASCTNSTNKTACYASLPSVTFTEIVLLTKYFNMDCYLLKQKTMHLYFFCIKNSMTENVEKYNKDCKDINHQLLKVTVLLKSNSIKIKYLKYKNKYLQLKKSILENTY